MYQMYENSLHRSAWDLLLSSAKAWWLTGDHTSESAGWLCPQWCNVTCSDERKPLWLCKETPELFVTLNTVLILAFLSPSEPSSLLRFLEQHFSRCLGTCFFPKDLYVLSYNVALWCTLEYFLCVHLTKPKCETLFTFFLSYFPSPCWQQCTSDALAMHLNSSHGCLKFQPLWETADRGSHNFLLCPRVVVSESSKGYDSVVAITLFFPLVPQAWKCRIDMLRELVTGAAWSL